MTSSDQETNWLDVFFSGDNRINVSSTHSDVVSRIAKAKEEVKGNKPIILLQSFEGGNSSGYFGYYLLTKTALLQSEVSACLKNALGTSHTYSHEILRSADKDFEQSLISLYKHGVIRIIQRINSPKDGNKYIEKVIRQTIERFSERPRIEHYLERALGRVLRDFFVACRTRDGDTAYEAYEEIKSRELLDHKNLLAMELQAYAAGQQWEKIVHHHNLSAYLGGVVTQRIALLVIRATAYHLDIDTTDIASIDWESVKEVVFENSQYFVKRPNIPNAPDFEEDWKRWAIFAKATGCNNFEGQLPTFIREDWTLALCGFKQQTEVDVSVQTSQLDALLSLEGSYKNATKVLEYAQQCYAEEVTPLFEWLESLNSKIRKDIKASRMQRKAWLDLENLYYQDDLTDSLTQEPQSDHETEPKQASDKPSSWNDWFAMEHPPTSISYEYFKGWKVDDFDVDSVIQSIQASCDAEIIRNTLPHFLTWIDEKSLNAKSKLWLELIELMSMDDYKSYSTLILQTDLLNRFLEQPHNSEEYAKVIEALSVTIEEEISKKSIDTIFEAFDLLLAFSIKELSSLQQLFLDTLLPFSLQKWQTLSLSQQLISKAIAQQLFVQSENLFQSSQAEKKDSESESAFELLKDLKYTVGIYSLTERAITRASEVIKTYCPQINIKANSDKANTPALENLAKSSDIILFCNKSAAHQAYFSIKNVNKDITYVNGKGASSIVRAFLDKVMRSSR